MDRYLTLLDYSVLADVSITTLWNWHRKGRIKIVVASTPRWVIDSTKYPPGSVKPLKRGKGSPDYKKG